MRLADEVQNGEQFQVARAGEQIDPVINVRQFPIRSGEKPLVGRAPPAPKFQTSDFSAQELNFGLELMY